jgi:hypothetical protein
VWRLHSFRLVISLWWFICGVLIRSFVYVQFPVVVVVLLWCSGTELNCSDDPGKGSKLVALPPTANKNECWLSSVYFVLFQNHCCVDWPLIFHMFWVFILGTVTCLQQKEQKTSWHVTCILSLLCGECRQMFQHSDKNSCCTRRRTSVICESDDWRWYFLNCLIYYWFLSSTE